MTRQTLVHGLLAGSLMLAAAFSVQSDVKVPDKPADLGGPDRYLTHISTDKPIYRPGESIYVRGVLLKADNRHPLKDSAQAMVEIKGPKGDTVASGMTPAQDSVAAFKWDIPREQAGGEYTIRISYPWHGFTPAERKFDIRAYRAPRLKSQITFVRDGYGPGDSVSASMNVTRAEGGIPAGAKVTAIARVDGAEVHRGQATVDKEGNCSANFKLPAEIARGEGTLAMVIEDGGAVETATKTIPILLQTVDLALYPEGGDLVAGLPNRVYMEARTPAKKPADIAGDIVDGKGNSIGSFRTEHEGRGRFTFTPEKGQQYTLKISEPAGIKTTYTLPAVKPSGVLLTSTSDIIAKETPVNLKLASTDAATVKVVLSKRDVEVASAKWKLPAGEVTDVTLTPPATADGVLVATVWSEDGKPLAERLVFRQPARGVSVQVISDTSTYVPGDKVSLRVKTTDAAGKPVGAVVGLTVTDDSVLEMIEKREQAARLPVMALFESDVRELADAHVYLDESNNKAPLAVDLLLGTQGWRRFAFVNPVQFIAQNGDAARRVLALRVATAREQERLFKGVNRNGGGEMDRFFDLGAARPAAAMAAGEERLLAEGKAGEDLLLRDEAAQVPADIKADARPAEVPAVAKDMEEALQQAEGKRERRALAPEMAKRLAPLQQMAYIREYAHPLRPNRAEGDRVDFAETLYWSAGVKTDASTGEATVSFHLSDAVTTFRAFADAFDDGGAVGSATAMIESVQPFYVEPKMPLELTSGDVFQLPVNLVNGMARDLPLAKIAIQPAPGITIGSPADGFTLKSKERTRRLISIDVGSFSGEYPFALQASAGPFSDRVTRGLRVAPMGFPVENAHGGLLASNSPLSRTLTIPDALVKDSVTTSINVYPTPLANLTEALERLIQEPSGCFEQTSSISYPLVMAQQYFLTHQGVDPKLIDKARNHLDSAYKRLAGYECKQKGYEWFGADPGHEALTAYGLLQFVDMSQVRDVDQKMIERTRKWLMDRRDGNGGFKRDSKALDSFGRAPEATTAAYIVWALLESGEKDLAKEIAAVKASALASDDSYVVALGANAMFLSSDKEAARKLMEKLAKKQTASGAVDGATTSITCSSGDALAIETTALSMLAWMRDPSFTPNVEKSMKFIADSCKSGRFGSTQSTILALRAIVNYDKARAVPKAPGTVTLIVDGKPVGKPVAFEKDTKGPIKLPDISSLMTPGQHTIELQMADGSAMPAAISVNYYNRQPESSDKCKVSLAVSLRNEKVQEGGITEAEVTITNKADEVIHMPIAIVGIPAGLEVRHDQLKELVKSGKIDAYEVVGREVILYWRGMKAKASTALPISLVAAIPGAYTAPASRAYLYYADEHKHWLPGMKATIEAVK